MSPPRNPMLAIAHRAGNSIAELRRALDAGADLVEADVHLHRGILEIRHHKILGRRHLWDKWEIVSRATVGRLELAELLAELGPDPRLMLDLKGIRTGLGPAVSTGLRTWAPGVPVTVCTQHWWMLDASFEPQVRQVLSAGSRNGVARLRRRLVTAPVAGVSVRLDLLTPMLVSELRAHAEVVMTWAVDTPQSLARARALGVDAVISKNLDLIAHLVEERSDRG